MLVGTGLYPFRPVLAVGGGICTKILTLNTHSLVEENYQQKLIAFMDMIRKERPDIIAMQEVNQSAGAAPADKAELDGLVPVPGREIVIRKDNHAMRVANMLHQAGIACSFTWLPVKLGYGIYDEGMAFLSLDAEITETDAFYISRGQDYRNWKTRMALGIKTDKTDDWFYTTHMGWWDDEEEPFQAQLELLNSCLLSRTADSRVWLTGDFNSPDAVRGQGYDAIRNLGWQDTYLLAEQKDEGITVGTVIDGWRDLIEDPSSMKGMRIDYIWSSRKVPVKYSHVIFNGKNGAIVSDHFGTIIEAETETENMEKRR